MRPPLCAALMAVGVPAAQAVGGLDPTFSEDGKHTTDFGTEDGADDVTVQPDGKIVVGGSMSVGR